jgi:hypothetical protein
MAECIIGCVFVSEPGVLSAKRANKMDTLASLALGYADTASTISEQPASQARTLFDHQPQSTPTGAAGSCAQHRATLGASSQMSTLPISQLNQCSRANLTAEGTRDPADVLLSSLIDVSQIRYFQNQTTAILHADEYANR